MEPQKGRSAPLWPRHCQFEPRISGRRQHERGGPRPSTSLPPGAFQQVVPYQLVNDGNVPQMTPETNQDLNPSTSNFSSLLADLADDPLIHSHLSNPSVTNAEPESQERHRSSILEDQYLNNATECFPQYTPWSGVEGRDAVTSGLGGNEACA